MEESKALKFLEYFSVITVGENKVPNFKWKEQQEKKISKEVFLNRLNFSGENPTKAIGIVTGFEFLEVIDVDTKVFSTQLEMTSFWDEYLSTLRDNIINFDEKFVVYQTKSGGYHIIYKSKRVVGNTKIASLKGHTEAVIESRGVGGYVFIYPDKKVLSRSYFDVDFISDEDRDTLWKISFSYNYLDEVVLEPKKNKKIYSENDIPPWVDFNQKNDIWDLISDDFSIPRNGVKSKHYLIKRNGAKSEHSGYVFKDSGCMYLFSTGTIYPHEKLLSPFVVYAYKYHGGDIQLATKELYEQGYGTRLRSKIEQIKPKIKDEIVIENIDFPIDIFPKDIQYYISECSIKLDSNIEYMGVSLLWLISICIGNSYEVEVKRGWIENSVVWIAVVGKAGIGKTPSINNIIFPLQKINSKEIKKYYQELEKFEHYNGLTKKEKEEYQEVEKPKKSQFIANDITLEALVDLHEQSDNSVGVFKDELAGWFKDMNKYRVGSDLEFWLSCWSSKPVTLNRMTRKGSFVNKPFISVLGGIQPNILNAMSTEENKDNGFIDRILLSYPTATINEYNDNELEYDLIRWYQEKIIFFYEGMKRTIKRDDENQIKPNRVRFSSEAKIEWKRMFNEITSIQNNDSENEYLKSMYPKQKSYIPRFSLLLNTFNSLFDDNISAYEISKKSILDAEKLSKYFISTAKKIKMDTTEIKELSAVAKKAETTFDKILNIYKSDNNFNRSKVAEMLGISRQTVISTINKIIEYE